MGLQGIINHMVEAMDFSTVTGQAVDLENLTPLNKPRVANLITAVEQIKLHDKDRLPDLLEQLQKKAAGKIVPVLGITGTGGSGKSSLTDELILRLLHDLPQIHIAIISCDPSRRKTGGALLGDRIRMNAIDNPRVYMRSLATRQSNTEIPDTLAEAILAVKAAGFDLIIAETAGIGQGDSLITHIVDTSMYVMTSEFGAASQLEKIDMLDYADIVVVNKFEKRGGEDAVRDVRKQVQRNRTAWDTPADEMPVYGTIASKFNDDGVTALYHALLDTIADKTRVRFQSRLPRPKTKASTSKTIIIPPERTRYLSEIADTIRSYHQKTEVQAEAVRAAWHLEEALKSIEQSLSGDKSELIGQLKNEIAAAKKTVDSGNQPDTQGMG